jgi:hypothetical protein
MKILWIVLGVLGCLCLVCAGGGYFLYTKVRDVSDDTGKFGDESFRAIAANWNVNEFKKRAAPEIEQDNGKDAIPNLMQRLSTQLGPLKGDFHSSVTNFQANNNNGVTRTTADWFADATFEKGSGHVTMELINRDGNWQILKFNVNSEALKGAPAGETKNDEPNLPSTAGTK